MPVTGEEAIDFDPKAIKTRIPGGLSSKQSRAAVALIRNPDAPIKRVAEKAGVSNHTVNEALRGLVRGKAPSKDGTSSNVWQRRGGSMRYASTYDELTDKQQAVADWLARHPGNLTKLLDKGDDNLTGPNVADAIATDDRYDVVVSESYPIRVAQEYTHVIRKRREDLAAAGELEDEDVAVETIRDRSPREWLEGAGIHVPESNLDDLEPATEEDPDKTEQELLEEAWQRAQAESDEEPVTEADRREYTAPYSCPACGREAREDFCSRCGEDKRYEWAKEGEDLQEEPGHIPHDMQPEGEVPEEIVTTARLEEYDADLEERLAAFEERVWDALRNSVKAEVVDDVDVHEGRLNRLEDRLAGLEATKGSMEVSADRVGHILGDMIHYAEVDAHVPYLRVDEGANETEYKFKVYHGGRKPRKGRDEDG